MSTKRVFQEPLDVDGIRVVVEAQPTIPLVDFVIVVERGAHEDPLELPGLSRFVARACRMGAGSLDSAAFEEKLAALGGKLSLDVGTRSVRFHGTVISRNLAPFFSLVAGSLLSPAFRPRDLSRVRRESLSDLASSRDDDRWVASRAFRRELFGDHPFSRSLLGTKASLRAIRREHVLDTHARWLRRGQLVVGFAGDVTAGDAEALVARAFSAVRGARRSARPLPKTRMQRGLSIVIVDKPDRTQCQLVVGTLGIAQGDDAMFPLHVANTAFGGMFSGRLVDEIRVKRGYSYGAGSRFGIDVRRDAWTMSTFPTAEHTVDCLALMLRLQDEWAEDGVTTRELRAAKSYLVNGRCFEDDTPSKRLDAKVETLVTREPRDHYVDFDAHVRRVTRESASEAVRSRISTRDRVVAVVGSARTLAPQLAALPGVRSVRRLRLNEVE